MSNKIVTQDNVKVGDKVVRGEDWSYDDQDEGSIYGIVYEYSGGFWVSVNWINHKGMVVHSNGYEVGPYSYDLYFYE